MVRNSEEVTDMDTRDDPQGGGKEPDITTILARDIMSRDFARVAPDTPLGDIIIRFSGKACPDLVVTDNDGTFRGVITPFDLMTHLNPIIGVRGRRKVSCIECMVMGEASIAADIMTRGHLTVREETPVMEVLRLLEKYHHPDLFVVDERGVALGVVSICGIISHLRIVGHL
jgi:CBS domain-containing protein